MTIPAEDPRPDDALTPAQLSFFRTFGYIVLRGRLPAAEVQALEAEMIAESERVHGAFDRNARQQVNTMSPTCPSWCAAFSAGRFVTPVRQMLGEHAIGIGTDANRYVGDTPWHPDHGHFPHPPRGIKCCVYLTPVTAETGALRVIPGSHLQPWPVSAELREAIGAFAIDAVPGVALDSQPGDVVMFNLRLWHGSCGGSSDRRMGTFVYYDAPRDAAEREEFRLQGANQAAMLRSFRVRCMYPADYAAHCHAHSPLRTAWLEALIENGYASQPGMIEAPLSGAAR